MDIWIEAEHVVPAADPADDNSDVIVTLADGSRWAATFVTYANIGSLRRKNEQTGECLSGRYLWASSMVIVDEITRPVIEAVVSDLQNMSEFERAFEKLVPQDTIRLIRDKSELRGSLYIELLPGKYRNTCWNEGSVFLSEETWGYVEPIIQELETRYDHYSFIDVRAETWRQIIARFRVAGEQVQAAQKVAQLPREVGFFFSTSRRELGAAFNVNRDALALLLLDLSEWIERQIEVHDSIAILGI